MIAVGPGFEVGKDCHFVVETNRGHHLGAPPHVGLCRAQHRCPGSGDGDFTSDRVLRAPAEGEWQIALDVGAPVKPGDVVGAVGGLTVEAKIAGVLRGVIRHGVRVSQGMKIGDIDPRGRLHYCFTISEKAFAVAGGVLVGVPSLPYVLNSPSTGEGVPAVTDGNFYSLSGS